MNHLKQPNRESWNTNSILNKIKDNKTTKSMLDATMFQPLRHTFAEQQYHIVDSTLSHTHITNYNYNDLYCKQSI